MGKGSISVYIVTIIGRGIRLVDGITSNTHTCSRCGHNCKGSVPGIELCMHAE